MAIKSIFCGKSKNLCDVLHLLTLPVDKSFEGYGYWEVEINVEPNTIYTFSRENANQINVGGVTYLGIINQYIRPSGSNTPWLNHELLSNLCHQNVQITAGAEGKLWIFFSANLYKKWQNRENPLGYLQLEKGSIATGYVPYELTSYKSVMKVSNICQLMDKSKYPATNTNKGVTFTNNGDGTVTLNGTSESGGNLYTLNASVSVIAGHYYYIYSGQLGTWKTCTFTVDKSLSASKAEGEIRRQSYSHNGVIAYLYIGKGATFNDFTVKPQFFDLTEMFGTGNEPKTVAEFKAKFPDDYYSYSPACFIKIFDERIPCKTNNLFNSSTEVGVPSNTDFSASNKRILEDGKWYIGLSDNNYYYRKNIASYSINSNSISLISNAGGYGLAKCLYVEPSMTYSISYMKRGSYPSVRCSFYQEDGTNISATTANHFTTPANCKFISIVFTTNRDNSEIYFSNIKIEKSSIITDYVPYNYV